MALRVHPFEVTTPASTPAASPQETALAIYPGHLALVEVTIPAGHVGITGLALHYADQRVLPFTGDGWVRGNDVTLRFPLALDVPGRTMQLVTFNPDKFAHTHLVRLHLGDAESLDLPGIAALPIDVLAP